MRDTFCWVDEPQFKTGGRYILLKDYWVNVYYRTYLENGIIDKDYTYKVTIINLDRKRHQRKHGF